MGDVVDISEVLRRVTEPFMRSASSSRAVIRSSCALVSSTSCRAARGIGPSRIAMP
jgi:hypothetical protein